MRRLVSTLALAMLAACGGDSSTNPGPVNVAGTWTLQSYNGQALPFVQENARFTFELLSGLLTLAENGAYTVGFTTQFIQAGAATTELQSDAGTFTVEGNTVTLRSSDPQTPNVTGTVTGNSATFNDTVNIFVFTKS